MSAVLGFGGSGNFMGSTPTVTANTTLDTTNNWMTIGPTTINTGITVTVNTGAYWIIL